jgi:hypothetical protein
MNSKHQQFAKQTKGNVIEAAATTLALDDGSSSFQKQKNQLLN